MSLASEFTPLAGLAYGDAISFQCHPEFTADFCAALLEARRAVRGPETDRALQSLREPHDSALMQHWIGRFVEG